MAMVYIREGESAIKRETRENIYASDRCLSVCVLSIWRKTDEKECRCRRGKQTRSTSRSRPRISSQYANEEESVLSQNDLDMVSTSGPNKQQEFCNQHAQAGFLGGMLRDGEKKRRDPRDIKALVRAGIV